MRYKLRFFKTDDEYCYKSVENCAVIPQIGSYIWLGDSEYFYVTSIEYEFPYLADDTLVSDGVLYVNMHIAEAKIV